MNKIDISYASKSEHNFAQRLIIKTIEQLTGKRKLEKIYREFSKLTFKFVINIQSLSFHY